MLIYVFPKQSLTAVLFNCLSSTVDKQTKIASKSVIISISVNTATAISLKTS